MVENRKRVLIVEDELISAEYLKEMLENAGYLVVYVAVDAQTAIRDYKMKRPDLVLMDIMLKGNISGSEAAVEIKRHDPDAKIIFLTAYATKEMLDYAVEAEAYGYLMKPYREEEILATIKLVFISKHRTRRHEHPETIALSNGYVFDVKARRLLLDGVEVSLGRAKRRLVEILAKNRDTTVSNEQLCTYVWGTARSDETLRSLIHRLRNAIGNDMIKNINGVGYEMTS